MLRSCDKEAISNYPNNHLNLNIENNPNIKISQAYFLKIKICAMKKFKKFLEICRLVNRRYLIKWIMDFKCFNTSPKKNHHFKSFHKESFRVHNKNTVFGLWNLGRSALLLILTRAPLLHLGSKLFFRDMWSIYYTY